MAVLVNGTTEAVNTNKGDAIIVEIVSTLFFDDGSVLRQHGYDEKWKAIRTIEFDKGPEVGICKDCKVMIFEQDEYTFSERDDWVCHAIVDDCKK